MRRPLRRAAGLALALVVVGLFDPQVAGAHPLGNASVNHYAGVVIGADEVTVDYVLDLAELPTVRALQDADAVGGPDAYGAQRCDELAAGLEVRMGDDLVRLRAVAGDVELVPGSAGLQTMRLECELRGATTIAETGTPVEVADTNPRSLVGWREITLTGDRVTLTDADVPSSSTSERLTRYPEGARPLEVREAHAVAAPGGDAAPEGGSAPFGSRVTAATDRFTSLIASDRVTIPLVAVSLVVAMAFGALHALAPGHGKSVIAAYLIGQRRDQRMALLLGAVVAVTHTASVLAFGGLISVTEAVAPERLYPLFGVVSGLLFVALGIALLRQVLARQRDRTHSPLPRPLAAPAFVGAGAAATHVHPHPHPHDHTHGADHTHEHDHDHPHPHDADHTHDHDHEHEHAHDHAHGAGHGHDHSHGPDDAWHEHRHVDLGALAEGDTRWRTVLLPGVAGGLVPSPSALLVFLGGLALGRAWFGVGLVLGYGVGIAVTLVTAGWLLLARAGDALTGERGLGRWPGVVRLAGYLPAATAVLVIAGGLHVAVRAAVQA